MSQLTLRRRRTFGALFWTQSLGAFNDNLLKSALVVLVAFEGGSLWGLGAQQFVPLSGALFIVPFFFFSATAWGSFFSRAGGAAMRRPFRRLWSKIQLVIDTPGAG